MIIFTTGIVFNLYYLCISSNHVLYKHTMFKIKNVQIN